MNEKDEWVKQQYQNDEEMMVYIFAQWCVNHALDPLVVYEEAYPMQGKNDLLHKMMTEIVPKEASDEIDTGLVLKVLQMFGNDDLAFVVQEKADQFKKEEE